MASAIATRLVSGFVETSTIDALPLASKWLNLLELLWIKCVESGLIEWIFEEINFSLMRNDRMGNERLTANLVVTDGSKKDGLKILIRKT